MGLTLRAPATLATFILRALLLTSACAAAPVTPEACRIAAPAQETATETRVRFKERPDPTIAVPTDAILCLAAQP